jgi:phage/conjugal plasmid C-4 type zinc finger TraR family protein
MADFADVASALESERLQQSLQNRQQFTAHSNFECDDCGEEIPQIRRELGGATRCIQCQTNFEAKQKHFTK